MSFGASRDHKAVLCRNDAFVRHIRLVCSAPKSFEI